MSVGLRKKINVALLDFAEAPEDKPLEEVQIMITPEEAWALDFFIKFDGIGNAGTRVLYEIFIGLDELDGEDDFPVMPNVLKGSVWDNNEIEGYLDDLP